MSVKVEGIPQNIVPADDFTGKKVVDREGIQYGKVKHIHINPKTLSVSGVTVNQGFHKDYFLSNEYIDKFTEETLLLSTPPIRLDSQVVDIDGHKIGNIKRIHRHPDTNEIESIEIHDGIMHSKIVSRSDIWGIGEKIILRMNKDEYKKSQ